ncbi:MAG: YihA family ribosome biogenesis GTP-binding protein [Alphaproteobacteria bacterium]|nr:YihA family ribosome biogenesis GTP-binding protein [Alphaproteobacteria bacterium]
MKDFFQVKPTFLGSFNRLDQIPVSDLVEVAFVGRSNVGKSSLINALTQTKGLARISSTPGRTQSLNFFNWDKQIMLVDLPGYGYAKAPKKLAKSWQGLMKDYLRGRVPLKRVFLLVDSRHGVKENDVEMMKMLDECAITYQLVFTKSDKISDKQAIKLQEETVVQYKKHPALFPRILMTSSEKGQGMDILRDELIELMS